MLAGLLGILLGWTGAHKFVLGYQKEGVIQPVETKRSAAPEDDDGEPTFWQNDAVQLCAQGLLVEEAFGIAVAGGVLYYVGSKARVDVPMGPALREATLAAIDRIRDLASRDTPPEPRSSHSRRP